MVTVKVYTDKTKAIVVIPKWPTQNWYPNHLKKATKDITMTLLAKKIQYNSRVHLKFIHYIESLICNCSWSENHPRIINVSLHKSTCQKYLFCQTRWNEFFADNKSYSWANSKLFFTAIFNGGVSHRVPVSEKRTVTHVLGMKYQHIPQHPSVIKYFKEAFNLRPP